MFETRVDQDFVPDSGLPVNGPVYLAKENITSEQTFQVIFQVLLSAPPASTLVPATRDDDYLYGVQGDAFVTRPFLPTDQKIIFEFSLLPDEDPERTEFFRVLAQSGSGGTEGEPSFPRFDPPVELTPETLVIIEDDDGM